MKLSAKQLIEARDKALHEMEVLTQDEQREWTPEETAQFDALKQQVADIQSQIDSKAGEAEPDGDEDEGVEGEDQREGDEGGQPGEGGEKNEQKSRSMAAPRNNRRAMPLPTRLMREFGDRRANENRDLALRGWALYGTGDLNDSHRRAARSVGFNLAQKGLNFKLARNAKAMLEKRDQATDPGSAGGFLVPKTLHESLEKTLLYYAELRNVAQVIRTDTGNPYSMPVVDDTMIEGEIIGENLQWNKQDVTLSNITLGAWKYTSKLVHVSIELLQDSAIDVPSTLGELLGERLGRVQARHFAVGDGVSEPQGLSVGASSAGQTAGTSWSTDDLLGLVHSLDRAYRPNAKFVMNDKTLLAIRRLKDNMGRPIFTESYIVGEPDRLFGYELVIDNYLDEKEVIFGELQKYVIRDALDAQLVRLDERFADFGQVAFCAILRTDAKVLVPNAIKKMTAK